MLTAQIALGVLALVCALLGLVVFFRMGDEQRVVVISLLALAVLLGALSIWALFLPTDQATMVP